MTIAEDLPTAVILAAGAGTRIGAAESRIPKPLTHLLGASLLARALAAVSQSRIRRAVVVTGYRADEVAMHARTAAADLDLDLTVVPSERWSAGNGASLLAAEHVVGDRAIVMMADHLTSSRFIRLLATTDPGDAAGLLVVDDDPAGVHDLEEATKVRLEGARIVSIGKRLAPFDAVDTGIFCFDHRIFDALRSEVAAGRAELSAAVQQLADRGLMRAVVSDGSFWCDIDTPEDVVYASGVLERHAQRAIIEATGPAVAASVG